jgi:hypothetical protein
MAEEVYMDIPQVQKMSEQFGTFGETLQTVSKVLEMTITLLRATAFVGFVGGAAVERYLSVIKPRVDAMANKMLELQGDLVGAINHYQTGDESGSSRFR